MMKTFKTVLVAATLATFGSSATTETIVSAEAEEVILNGEIIDSSIQGNEITRLLIEYKSKLFYCFVYVLNTGLATECHSR